MFSRNDQEQFLIKKSYEICYALVRIAFSVKRESFARRLEENGFLLLEAAASGEFAKTSRVSTAVEYLLRLGSDVGFVHPANAETISRESQQLNSVIAEYMSGELAASGNAAKAEKIELGDIFSAHSTSMAVPVSPVVSSPSAMLRINSAKESDQKGHPEDIRLSSVEALAASRPGGVGTRDDNEARSETLDNGNGNCQRSVFKMAIRQSAILERIRQNGHLSDGETTCRIKEIQEVLPGVSERTIRYDIQRLLEQGFIERIGNGGPATAYRVAQ